MPEILLPHAGALTFVAATILIVLLQGFVSAFFRNAVEKHVAGAEIPADHANPTYRQVRAFANSQENIPLYAALVGLAIAAGVAPAWVWWVALIVLIGRIGHWGCYSLNIQPFRTVFFAAGSFATLALAIVTLLALL